MVGARIITQLILNLKAGLQGFRRGTYGSDPLGRVCKGVAFFDDV